MKLAFIGTHGVGKTTLCFDLAARLKRLDYGVDMVKEVARDCPLPINRETTLDAQTWILHTQIARETVSAARYELVVCDRSVLDNYAYLVHAAGPQRHLEPMVEAWLGTYDALFKVPIWQPPRFDGVRDTSRTFQTGIDRTLEELIGRFGSRVTRLDPGGPEAWTQQILEVLALPKRPHQEQLFGDLEGDEG